MNDQEPPERDAPDEARLAMEARRLSDQSRQNRNGEYASVVSGAADSVGRMLMADGTTRFSEAFVQVRAVMVSAIDMISESMVTGEGVSKDDLRDIVVGYARRQVPSLSDEDGDTLADGMLRQLSNADDRHRPFVRTIWDIEGDRAVEFRFRLVEFVSVEGVGHWRLTDKGLYLALVLMEGGGDVTDADVVEMALHKAISRGKWDDVTGQATKALKHGQFLAAELRMRVQQARSAISYDWSRMEGLLARGRALVDERRRATCELVAKVDEAALTQSLSDADHVRLAKSRAALVKAEEHYSHLSALLVESPLDFSRLCLAQAGRRVIPSLMPDIGEAVLRPLMAMPTRDVGEFLDLVAGAVLPTRLPPVLDVNSIVSEIEAEIENLDRPARQRVSDDDVYVLPDDAWGLDEAVRLDALLAPILPGPGGTTLLSDLLGAIATGLSGEPANVRNAAIVKAILSDTDKFELEPTGSTFALPGIARGDELMITRRTP